MKRPVVWGLITIATAACTTSGVSAPQAPEARDGGDGAGDPPPPEPAETQPADLDANVPSPQAGACPTDMVLAEGAYCAKPIQICKRWLDPPGPYQDYRCADYVSPSRCPGAKEQKRFCIDREEYAAPGEELPLGNQSWTSAGEVCAKLDKRLCLESEWQFACEGEEMLPYPYCFTRDATACNIDRTDLGRPNGGLKDLREPISAHPKCLSPFGVHGMSGNIEEWATQDDGHPPDRSTMKGAWWLPGKNTCRARTLGHGEKYRGKQVGVRCCKDAG
ncbi:hypothetical protein BH09MYX1_BH09MYX1_28600 [soil metagenome]